MILEIRSIDPTDGTVLIGKERSGGVHIRIRIADRYRSCDGTTAASVQSPICRRLIAPGQACLEDPTAGWFCCHCAMHTWGARGDLVVTRGDTPPPPDPEAVAAMRAMSAGLNQALLGKGDKSRPLSRGTHKEEG